MLFGFAIVGSVVFEISTSVAHSMLHGLVHGDPGLSTISLAMYIPLPVVGLRNQFCSC